MSKKLIFQAFVGTLIMCILSVFGGIVFTVYDMPEIYKISFLLAVFWLVMAMIVMLVAAAIDF